MADSGSGETLDETATLRWNASVACRTLEGTAFILLNSRMVRLNEVGTRIWELFEEGSTIARVVDEIVAQYDASPERVSADARAFVSELVAKEMLVPVEHGSQKGRSP